MNLNQILNKIRSDVADLEAQTSKLASRQVSSASGGSSSSSDFLREVETFDDLPDPDTVPLKRLYKIRSGTYASGIAYVYSDGVNPRSWRLLNYWQ